MAIINPTQLVDEFKKSGEFDRLRRELLTEFQRGDGISSFKTRIEDIARQRLLSDQKLQYMPQESVTRELMQEMDRYPIVERAVADVRMLSDSSFASDIRSSVQRILREDRGQKSEPRNDTVDEAKSTPPDVRPDSFDKPNALHPAQHEAPSQPSPAPISIEVVPASPGIENTVNESSPAQPLVSEVAQCTEKLDTVVTPDPHIGIPGNPELSPVAQPTTLNADSGKHVETANALGHDSDVRVDTGPSVTQPQS